MPSDTESAIAYHRLWDYAHEIEEEARALAFENERLLSALTRLVELGEDDGSTPDTAWKDAFTEATALIRHKST